MIVYDRLWMTMQQKNITKSKLVGKYGLSPSLITRLKRNESITINTVNTLCQILECNVEDILEYIDENNT